MSRGSSTDAESRVFFRVRMFRCARFVVNRDYEQANSGDDRRTGAILSGLGVVECGEGIAAAFGAQLMADLGADLIKVEPPAGDILRRRGPFPPGEKPDRRSMRRDTKRTAFASEA